MKSLFLLLGSFVFSTSVLALPQTVQLKGSFDSSRGGFTYDVAATLKLKKEDSKKAKYTGRMEFIGQVLNQTQSIEITVSKVKNKTEGVVNTYDGYIAFDAKNSYSFDLNQELTMNYSEFQHQHDDPFCDPLHNNFCNPTNMPDRIVDDGVLHLSVIQAQ